MFPQILNNPLMFQQQLKNFAQSLQGRNPQQIVQELLNSGKMTQSQFNQLRDMANKITGQRL